MSNLGLSTSTRNTGISALNTRNLDPITVRHLDDIAKLYQYSQAKGFNKNILMQHAFKIFDTNVKFQDILGVTQGLAALVELFSLMTYLGTEIIWTPDEVYMSSPTKYVIKSHSTYTNSIMNIVSYQYNTVQYNTSGKITSYSEDIILSYANPLQGIIGNLMNMKASWFGTASPVAGINTLASNLSNTNTRTNIVSDLNNLGFNLNNLSNNRLTGGIVNLSNDLPSLSTISNTIDGVIGDTNINGLTTALANTVNTAVNTATNLITAPLGLNTNDTSDASDSSSDNTTNTSVIGTATNGTDGTNLTADSTISTGITRRSGARATNVTNLSSTDL
jgi:hypothetical protein